MLGELTRADVQRRIDTAARQFMDADPRLSVAQARCKAQDKLFSEQPALHAAYWQAPAAPARTFSQPQRAQSFEERSLGALDARAQRLMDSDATLSIHQARMRLLDQHPELAAEVDRGRRADGAGLWQQGTGALPPPPWWSNPNASLDAMARNATPESWENWAPQSPIPGLPQRGQPQPIGSAHSAEALPRPMGQPLYRASEDVPPERQERALRRILPKLSQAFAEKGLEPPSQLFARLAAAAAARGQ
jgi:hypothetical protein